jgi:hypothetical protein
MRIKSVSILAALCSCCLFASSTVARSWVEVPPPIPSPGNISGIAAVTDTDVWSVGFQLQDGANVVLTEHWDGSTWSVMPAQMPPDPYSFFSGVIALNSRNVWAVGYSLDGDGVTFSNLVEHWDGTSWQIVPSPNVELRDNLLYAISAVSPNDIWAVGYTDTISGAHYILPLALHWDGTAWMVVPTPATRGAFFLAVKAIASDDVWAVGEKHGSAHALTSTTYILHWDGTLWSVVPSPNGPAAINALSGVSGVASNDVWAVGYTGASFTDNGAFALHWDGTAWTIVPTAGTSGGDPLYAVVAVTSHNVWAVGTLGGAPLTEQWNGTAWSVVPTPPVEPGAGLTAISASRKRALWASGFQGSDELFLKLAR